MTHAATQVEVEGILKDMDSLAVVEYVEIESLIARINSLVEALEFYARSSNWCQKYDGYMGFITHDPSDIETDNGKRARIALADYRETKE